ncbi:hypothetical protein [Planosporangium mesophilum]|uniref:Uncharacterized protein n=1 Tax=Planosporangium mesophilum TaxID=689768 RepID=A0A8J3X2H7_9ACTN|nr:hypothetical protein [Planosporangium mesophilum]NJC82534.1 hypothetical protein [Planosporangium mesophilum]GII25460.1 hypothetical protein Pme01_50570 [Planosporangium mesophilum]
MGEIARRVVDVVAGTVGDTVNPAVTGLLATAAVVTRNPELAVLSVPTGALAGALTEQGVQLVTQTLRDRAHRVQQFADAVEDETGQPIEDFVAEHVTDGAKRTFLGETVDAVTDAKTAWKIKVLARVFVQGAKDGDLIEETALYVNILRDLEAAHARFLAAMKAAPADGPGRSSTLKAIIGCDAGLAIAAPILYRHLIERGIVKSDHENIDGPYLRLTDLGSTCADWLENLGEEANTSG